MNARWRLEEALRHLALKAQIWSCGMMKSRFSVMNQTQFAREILENLEEWIREIIRDELRRK